ncbi:MAG: hypothetical protein WBJ37_06305 [Bacteroidales bacterium]
MTLKGSVRPPGLRIREPKPELRNPVKEFPMFSRSLKTPTLFQRLGHRAAGDKGLRSDETCKLNNPTGLISACLNDASSRNPE